MPQLEEIQAQKKAFKKREYRPWDLGGDSHNKPNKSSEDIIEVNCNLIVNWEHNDRPLSEQGNIEDLANEFKQIGQLHPCIVRPTNDTSKYELIVGERRWRAAQLAELPLKVVIRNLSDSEAAIIQASENFNRLDISDFARGMNYARLIEKKIITQSDLVEKLGISKQQVSRLLSFSKLPQEIVRAIGDMSKVSARTAEYLKQISAGGEKYINLIIRIADRIREGRIGHSKISEFIEKNIAKLENRKKKECKIYSKTGLPLFVITAADIPSFRFNKNAITILKKKNCDIESIAIKLSQVIDDFIYNS